MESNERNDSNTTEKAKAVLAKEVTQNIQIAAPSTLTCRFQDVSDSSGTDRDASVCQKTSINEESNAPPISCNSRISAHTSASETSSESSKSCPDEMDIVKDFDNPARCSSQIQGESTTSNNTSKTVAFHQGLPTVINTIASLPKHITPAAKTTVNTNSPSIDLKVSHDTSDNDVKSAVNKDESIPSTSGAPQKTDILPDVTNDISLRTTAVTDNTVTSSASSCTVVTHEVTEHKLSNTADKTSSYTPIALNLNDECQRAPITQLSKNNDNSLTMMKSTGRTTSSVATTHKTTTPSDVKVTNIVDSSLKSPLNSPQVPLAEDINLPSHDVTPTTTEASDTLTRISQTSATSTSIDSNMSGASAVQTSLRDPLSGTASTSQNTKNIEASLPRAGDKRKLTKKTQRQNLTAEKTDDSDENFANKPKKRRAPDVDVKAKWSLDEKKKLLEALQTDKGRRWWGRLAANVGTKNVDQVKHYMEILRAQATDTQPIHLEEADSPLQAWIVACEQLIKCNDDVDAKCIPQVMTIAAVEPLSLQGPPTGPNYNRIYSFLSGVLRGQPEVALSPIDAKVVLELLHSLEVKVSSVNSSEQINFLRTKFKNITTDLEQEQLVFAIEELQHEIKRGETQGPQGSQSDPNAQKAGGVSDSRRISRTGNEQTIGQSSLNPINVPVSLLNLVNKSKPPPQQQQEKQKH